MSNLKQEYDAQLDRYKKDLEENQGLVKALRAIVAMKDASHQSMTEEALLTQREELQKKLDQAVIEHTSSKSELENKLMAAVEEIAAKEALLESKDKAIADLQQNQLVQLATLKCGNKNLVIEMKDLVEKVSIISLSESKGEPLVTVLTICGCIDES